MAASRKPGPLGSGGGSVPFKLAEDKRILDHALQRPAKGFVPGPVGLHDLKLGPWFPELDHLP